jgi:repressor LexA
MERDVYDYLVDYLREHTYQPSVREIGGRFGIKSTKTVAAHLQALAEKGWVERDPSRSRGVRLLASSLFPDTIEVRSFRSMAEEGDPFNDDLCDGSFYLDRGFTGCDHAFLYPMGGNGFREDGIMDGDTLLVAPASEPDVQPGDLVLARVDRRGVVRRFGEARGNGATPDGAKPSPGAGNGRHVAGGSGIDDGWGGQIIGRVVGVYRRVAPPTQAD